MSRIQTPAMSRMQNFARNPVMIALVAGLALAGCANKKNMANSAGDLGLGAGAATPGSAQDFTVNVGDRIFFDTDFYLDPHGCCSDARPPGAVARSLSKLCDHGRGPRRRARYA